MGSRTFNKTIVDSSQSDSNYRDCASVFCPIIDKNIHSYFRTIRNLSTTSGYKKYSKSSIQSFIVL